MKNILYCIIHTQHQNNRIKNITNTWGKNNSVIFYSDHDDSSNNCYKVCERSDYSSGQLKQINVFNLLLNQFNNYEWYFFCDNDTFVNTTNLDNYIINAERNHIHGEIINTWPQDTTLYYPSGGAGYLMHNSILQNMMNISYNNTQYGDVSIGINFRNKKIPLKHNNLFKGQLPEFYGLTYDRISEYMTFHYVTSYDTMEKLYLNSKNQNDYI
jgi:hypothetical protein